MEDDFASCSKKYKSETYDSDYSDKDPDFIPEVSQKKRR